MSNNGVIWILGNNGGMEEITHNGLSHALLPLAEIEHALLSLAKLHALLSLANTSTPLIGQAKSCISHAFLSLANLMLSSHWLSWSCISHATTKVQP
jgi:hypothetical protein